jgi:two-component system NtrC family sensor kinase
MRFTRLLGFKLFLIIAGVMFVGTMIFAMLTLDWHTNQYLRNTIASVARISDVIQRSMHYSMLLNRREDIDHIVRTVGNEPGIEAVRIYNKQGVITFSSNAHEIGTVVNFSDKACSACHTTDGTIASPTPSDLTRIFERDYRIIGMITPIRNEASCATADCHAHPASQTVLGVLDVLMPLQDLDQSLAELKYVQYTNALILVLAVTLFSGVFIWLMVNIPVKKLIRGTEEIRRGNLDHRIRLRSNDEIGTLANSFNTMTDDLRKAQHELKSWAHTLEQRVQEKTEELRRAQASMIQIEKMASLGTLAATVAHELNNPLEGVLTYAKLLKRKVLQSALPDELKHDFEAELTVIADETARCGTIVKNLLLFSRQMIGEFREVNLVEILSQCFKLINHMLKINNVKFEMDVRAESTSLIADPSQLEQVFLAIAINAVEAMPGGGTLRVTVDDDRAAGFLQISFSDTGIGISDEDLPRIFEPFFTTKRDGKGTGLGLAVSYGIIERHGGTIHVTSRLHEGTTFTISLPRQPSARSGASAAGAHPPFTTSTTTVV